MPARGLMQPPSVTHRRIKETRAMKPVKMVFDVGTSLRRILD